MILERHLQDFFEAHPQSLSQPLCLSLSGGADSTALFHLMRLVRESRPMDLHALHINFGLRGEESNRDQSFVEDLCRKHDIPLVVKSAPSMLQNRKSAIQESARNFRREALQILPSHWQIVEAHHADDQIETLLFRMLRGGLSVMHPVSIRDERKILRPFLWRGEKRLAIGKKELLKYLKERGFSFCEDSSNREVNYDRNFLRNQILPQLRERFPNLKSSLLRKSWEVQEEREWISEEAMRVVLNTRAWEFNRKALKAMPQAFRKKVLHYLLTQRLHVQVSYERLEELSHLLEASQVFHWNGPEGLLLSSSRDGERVLCERMVSGVRSPVFRLSQDLHGKIAMESAF